MSLKDKFVSNIDFILLSMLLVKFFVLGSASFAESAVLMSLMGFIAHKAHLQQNKKYTELQSNLNEAVKKYNEVINKQNEVITKTVAEVDAIKTSMVGLKLGQGYKKMTGTGGMFSDALAKTMNE